MNSPFFYTDVVTGPTFIGRDNEVDKICNLIRSRKHILIYGPARIGKRSLILNSLNRLQQESYRYTLFKINLFNIRCIEAFMLRYTNTIFSYFATSPMEWNTLLKKYLPAAPYIIDEEAAKPQLTYTSKEPLTDEQIVEIVNLPDNLAKESHTNIIVYFEQFQDIHLFDDPHRIYKLLEKMWQKHQRCSYIITGERKNAMDEIFVHNKYFYKFTEKIELDPIDENIFADFIMKGFSSAGKLISKEQALTIYRSVGGDPWYSQHLSDICYNMTDGKMSDNVIPQALQYLINLHDFLFHSIAYGLSKHQLRFIKALLEGVTKFSSADILDKYHLNSSANVNRIKEALAKKEILTTNENKEIVFIDPLFRLWFTKYFFNFIK